MSNLHFGYQGLAEPYTDINAIGQKITYYPNGRKLNNATGKANKASQEELNKELIFPITITLIGVVAGYLLYKKRSNKDE